MRIFGVVVLVSTLRGSIREHYGICVALTTLNGLRGEANSMYRSECRARADETLCWKTSQNQEK
jgi:hypothetical protein